MSQHCEPKHTSQKIRKSWKSAIFSVISESETADLYRFVRQSEILILDNFDDWGL